MLANLHERKIAMNELPYKGYVIEALPEQLLGDGKWTISLLIWKHRGSHSTNKPFEASGAFTTKEEAIEQCFNFGKQIIDGHRERLSVSDL
jgi:hypothetical protein